jgi:hypothetical protein
MKLFAFYIGGETNNSLVEVHDARFIMAETMEDCYQELRDTWWGTPKSLHIDCYGELTQAEGYRVKLSKEPPPAESPKLYFINLGGYLPGHFEELHKNVFVVAPTESKAKARALQQILNWSGHHKDYQYDVEHSFCINQIAEDKQYHLHLEKIDDTALFPFKTDYFYINK